MTKETAIQASNVVLKARVGLEIAAGVLEQLNFTAIATELTRRAKALEDASYALDAEAWGNPYDAPVDPFAYANAESIKELVNDEDVPF